MGARITPKMVIVSIFRRLDLPKFLSRQLFGEEHSHTHRMIAGVIVMVAGGMIVEIHVGSEIVGLCIKIIGYSLHGFGLHPFIEGAAK